VVGAHDMACTHEALSPYTRDGSGGPTPTTTAQKRFAQRLRGVLSRINARLREAIIDNDLFNLRDEALVDDVPDRVFDFPTSRAKITGFLRWLRNQLDEKLLTVVGEDNNQFIRQAYLAGVRNVHNQLSETGVVFERPELDDLVTRPLHATELRTLAQRTYENLQSVRDDVAQGVRDELLDGFRDGQNPREIARSLTDRVDSIGKHRATMIARSEVMNAYSEGTLRRTEELNRDTGAGISVAHGEWDAAMDTRTCPFCRALDGVDLTPSEMRSNAVQFRGSVYRLKPPAHPNGRCNTRVMPGSRPEGSLSERLPAEINLLS